MSKGDWARATKMDPCPICEHESWCLIKVDGSAVICPRIEQGSVKHIPEAGWLHEIDERNRGSAPEWRKPADLAPRIDAKAIAIRAYKALRRQHPTMPGTGLGDAASVLGVSERSLDRLRVGWSDEHMGLTFPMRDRKDQVIGIRIRSLTGAKWCEPGSRTGLFIPRLLSKMGPLYICEGPTDTAAVLDMGFDCIGRPSCSGGAEMITDVMEISPRPVVIVSDRDGPGVDGAAKLAERLRKVMPEKATVTIITPPQPYKDVREWRKAGATKRDLLQPQEAA